MTRESRHDESGDWFLEIEKGSGRGIDGPSMTPQVEARGRDVAGSRPAHVVIADDDREMRNMLAWALVSSGHEVTTCSDGNELIGGLAATSAWSEQSAVDLIVADILMPGATGIEVLEYLRSWGSTSLPPVLLISAFPDESIRERACQLGAGGLLAKPFPMDDFLESVARLIGDGRATRRTRQDG